MTYDHFATTTAWRAPARACKRLHANACSGLHSADGFYGPKTLYLRAERIGAPLSREHEAALIVLTAAERAAVLVAPAGTGKGVVIDAATRAEQLAGRETIGVAVSGSTAERLGRDSPALQGQTLTLDSLVARAERGNLHVGPDTTVSLTRPGWSTTIASTSSRSWSSAQGRS